MKIVKKMECRHCSSVVEENGQCACGKIKLIEGSLIVGVLGVDAKDISAKLLNE